MPPRSHLPRLLATLALSLLAPAGLGQNSARDQQFLKALQMTGETIEKIKADNRAAREQAAAQAQAAESTRRLRESRQLSEDQRVFNERTRGVLKLTPPAGLPGRLVIHRKTLLEGNVFAPTLTLRAKDGWIAETHLNQAGDILVYRSTSDRMLMCLLKSGGRTIELPGSATWGTVRFGRDTVTLHHEGGWIASYDLEGNRLAEANLGELGRHIMIQTRRSAGGTFELLVHRPLERDALYVRDGRVSSRFAVLPTARFQLRLAEANQPPVAVLREWDAAAGRFRATAQWDLGTGNRLSAPAEDAAVHDDSDPAPPAPPTELLQRIDRKGSADDTAIRFLPQAGGPAWRHPPNPGRVDPTDKGQIHLVHLSARPLLAAVGLGFRDERCFTFSSDVLDLDRRAPVQRFPGFLVSGNSRFTYTLSPRERDGGRDLLIWLIETEEDLRHASALAIDDYESVAQYRSRIASQRLEQNLRLKIVRYDADKQLLDVSWRGLLSSLKLPPGEARKLGRQAFVEARGVLQPVDRDFLEVAGLQLRCPDGSLLAIPAETSPPAQDPAPAKPAALPPEASRASNGSTEEIIRAFRRLEELRSAGVLTEEEFQARRKALVERIP